MPNRPKKHLFNVWRALINLKDTLSLFETGNFDMNVSGASKRIRLTDGNMSMVVLGNFDVQQQNIDPNFYSTGKWYEYFSGNELDVTDVNSSLLLQAGEYRIYTDSKLEKPSYLGIHENSSDASLMDATIFPNPTNSNSTLNLTLKQSEPLEISIIDLQGREIKKIFDGKLKLGVQTITFNVNKLQPGLYFVTINGKQQMVKKLIVK